jgi:hypothetical protein
MLLLLSADIWLRVLPTRSIYGTDATEFGSVGMIDAFGNIGEPFHVLSFDKAGQTGLQDFSSMMYGNDRIAKPIRNAHLFGIAKAAIASLTNE